MACNDGTNISAAAVANPEITMQYLLGKVSFEDYSSYLEHEVVEDDPAVVTQDDVAENVEVETAVTVNDEDKQEPKNVGKIVHRSILHRNPELHGLMGEANLQFARGNHKEAIKMCMEVIRLAPRASEPFQTLAIIYEELGDDEKHLEFSLIAAHLSPSDTDAWLRLVDIYLEKDNIPSAIQCYDRAIRSSPLEIELVRKRCSLLESIGETRRAKEDYMTILKLMPMDQDDEYVKLARDMYDSYLENNDKERAALVMHRFVDKHPNRVSIADINNLLELYLTLSVYDKPVEVMVNHCGVVLRYLGGKVLQHSEKNIVKLNLDHKPIKCWIPDDLHIDLRSKIVISFIHLSFKSCVHDAMASVLGESAEEIGDIFLEIAEAFMAKNQHLDAKPLLINVTETSRYGSLGGVWLRLGECLNALGELQPAVQAYEKVVALAPEHVEARVALSTLEQQLGRTESALQALNAANVSQDAVSSLETDVRLLLPRCMLLYSQSRYAEFLDCAKQFLYGLLPGIFLPRCVTIILSNRCFKHRVHALRCSMGPQFDNGMKLILSGGLLGTVTADDFWELYLLACDVIVNMNDRQQLQEFCIAALALPQFMEDPHRGAEVDFRAMTSCVLNRNGQFAYPFVRDLLVHDIQAPRIWNLLSQVVSMTDDLRHCRFVMRLRERVGDSHYVQMMSANNALMAGSYRTAIADYLGVMRATPRDPLPCLLLAVTFMHLACQRFSRRKHEHVIQTCAFLNHYRDVRGTCQESLYNCGRAMHHLGLYHAAIYYYEQALKQPPMIPREAAEGEAKTVTSQAENLDIYDLRKDIAFNLCSIYRKTGNLMQVRYLMQEFITI